MYYGRNMQKLVCLHQHILFTVLSQNTKLVDLSTPPLHLLRPEKISIKTVTKQLFSPDKG